MKIFDIKFILIRIKMMIHKIINFNNIVKVFIKRMNLK